MPPRFEVEAEPKADELAYLEEQVISYNLTTVGALDYQPLAVFARSEEGDIVAGLSGYTWAGFCEIKFVWVKAALRGQGYGSKLLALAEEEVKRRGCEVIILASYSFQAPGFYLKQGYEVIGKVEDCPPGYSNVYLCKSLKA